MHDDKAGISDSKERSRYKGFIEHNELRLAISTKLTLLLYFYYIDLVHEFSIDLRLKKMHYILVPSQTLTGCRPRTTTYIVWYDAILSGVRMR